MGGGKSPACCPGGRIAGRGCGPAAGARPATAGTGTRPPPPGPARPFPEPDAPLPGLLPPPLASPRLPALPRPGPSRRPRCAPPAAPPGGVPAPGAGAVAGSEPPGQGVRQTPHRLFRGRRCARARRGARGGGDGRGTRRGDRPAGGAAFGLFFTSRGRGGRVGGGGFDFPCLRLKV